MKKITLGLLVFMLSFTLKAQEGQPDATFGEEGFITGSFSNEDSFAETLAIQSDGKILVAGNTGPYYALEIAAARYNEDGTIDESFANGGKLQFPATFEKAFIKDMTVQNDGKIVLGGYQWNDITGDFILARLNNDGSLDTDFGNEGIAILDNGLAEIGKAIAIQNDGKIIIAGDAEDQFAMARVNPDGSIDTDFGTDGWVGTVFTEWSYVNGMGISPDGEIVLTGMTIDAYGDWKMAVTKYDNSGNLDTSFGTNGQLILSVGNDYDYGIKALFTEDGKILIGGHSYFGTAPLRYEIAVAQLNADGSLDTNYGVDGISKFRWLDNGENYLNDMALQADGKLVISGRSYDNNYYFSVARLNSNGELDATFGNEGKINDNVDGYPSNDANAVAIQEDGKAVITGQISDYENPRKFFVARYGEKDMGITDSEISNFSVYPNPTAREINLEINGNKADVLVEIYNVGGQKIMQTKIGSQGKIDVSKLSSGIYFIQIDLNGSIKTQKFIKK